MNYRLYYWAGIQGRGEFVRLALEEAGAKYMDMARTEDGEDEMIHLMQSEAIARPSLAPPFLQAGATLIGQTANILQFLGREHGLAPQGEAGRQWINQLQLTVADFVAEAHDVHHPISGNLYYEEQKAEALRRAEHFREERLPKYLGYFDRVLAKAGGKWIAGSKLTYADLSLFQIVEGLRFAFPKSMKRLERKFGALAGLRDRVANRPRIAAYLKSDRRLPFTNADLFRHYPELDG